MGKKSRERKERKIAEKKARQAGLAELAAVARTETPQPASISDAMSAEGPITLYHATTKAVIPPGIGPFELVPVSQHGGTAVWPEEIAPRELVYLGDAATAIVFMGRAADVHEAEPVLLEATLDWAALQPDPAYLEAVSRLARLGHNAFGTTAVDSLFWSGRVATVTPVTVQRRLHAKSGQGLVSLLRRSRVGTLVERWHDDTIWQEAARANHLRARSGAEWRELVGRHALAEIFVEY